MNINEFVYIGKILKEYNLLLLFYVFIILKENIMRMKLI